jgi:hypothetical protein
MTTVTHRFLLAASLAFWAVFSLVTAPSTAVAQPHIDYVVYPLTGEVQFRNAGATPIPFVYYSITSNSNSLHGEDGVWLSITDTYAVNGNGFIDPTGEWAEISTGPTELTEGALTNEGVLPPNRAISLGRILTPLVYESDLTVEIFAEGDIPVTVFGKNAVHGDYNGNDRVDMGDYAVWKTLFGASFAVMVDGNLDGVVNAADYTVWRDHLGQTWVPAGEGSSSGGAAAAIAVPEPGTLVLAVGILGGLVGWRLSRRRRA